MRELVIGDIHGCSQSFLALLEIVEPRSDDVFVLLGDYIDRGPDSRGVIEAILDLSSRCTVVPIRGNHEIMFQRALQDSRSLPEWLKHGGHATLDSYQKRGPRDPAVIPERHRTFLLEQTLDYWETAERIFVHATVDPEADLAEQTELHLFWEKFRNPTVHKSGKPIICGHASQKSGLPAAFEKGLCIDTWPAGKGWLTCYDTHERSFIQTNERGGRRTFTLRQLLGPASTQFDTF